MVCKILQNERRINHLASGIHVYFKRCANGELYVGSTENMEEHFARNLSGHGYRSISTNKVYTKEYPTYEEAFKRERQLHGWSRAKKKALIKGNVEILKTLSKSKK